MDVNGWLAPWGGGGREVQCCEWAIQSEVVNNKTVNMAPVRTVIPIHEAYNYKCTAGSERDGSVQQGAYT